MRQEIRIAGFGGQGVITIGVLLAKGIGQFAGKPVAQTQSYGPESRGGACKTDVVISDTEIDYIKPLKLDALLAMSQPGLNGYESSLPDDGLLLIDSSLVTEVPARFKSVWSIPATNLAEMDMGMRVVANVIMFGALARVTGWISPELCKKALEDTMPKKVIAKNLEAFDLGYAKVSQTGGRA